MNRARARLRRIAVLCLGALVVLLALGAAAPVVIRGRRFGELVEHYMPAMRGKISVGGGSWSWGAVWALARGRPAPFDLEDVVVVDPDGVEVLRAHQLRGAIEIGRSPLHVVVRDLHVAGASWRMLQAKGRRRAGFVAAFEPRARGERGVGGAGSSSMPGTFRIEGARLEGVDVEFDLPGWGLTLRDAWATGNLAIGPVSGSPVALTFEVVDGDVRRGGQVSIGGGGGGNGSGARRASLPFTSAQITRIATTAEALDAIQIAAHDIRTGRSRSSLRSRFGFVAARRSARLPGLDVHVDIADAADAVQATAAGHVPGGDIAVSGRGATLAAAFTGTYATAAIEARAAGFDVAYRGLKIAGLGFRFDGVPAAGRVDLRELSFASSAGGRLDLDAHVDRGRARADLVLDRFVAGPYLPRSLLELGGGTYDGCASVDVDFLAGTAAVAGVALTIARPPGLPGPPVVHFGTAAAARAAGGAAAGSVCPPANGARGAHVARTVAGGPDVVLGHARLDGGKLRLGRSTLALWGGHVSLDGEVALWDAATRDWLPSPSFDLRLRASRVAVARVVGTGFVQGPLSLTARARGTFASLRLDVAFAPGERLQIIGEPFLLPRAVAVTLDRRGVDVGEIALVGDGGARLSAGGRVGVDGQLALDVAVDRFPLRKLPGLREIDLPLDGQLSGRLRLGGVVASPGVEGRLSIADATYAGRPLGGGSLAVTPGPNGGVRARGQIVDGVEADGSLAPGPHGFRGDVTLVFRRLRLDPFLASLPGGVTASGTVSGVAAGRVAPGQKPSLDARLSELAVSVMAPSSPSSPSSPSGTGRSARAPALAFHAEHEVHVSTPAGGGALRMDAARFSGDAGAIDLEGELTGAAASGHASGRIDLARLSAFAPPAVERLAGSVDLDARASVDVRRAHARLDGSISIATPISFRARGIPIDARVPSGRVVFSDTAAEVRALPIEIGRGRVLVSGGATRAAGGGVSVALAARGELDPRVVEPFVRGYVQQIDGRIGVFADVTGPAVDPRVRARLALAGVGFTLPVGANRVRVAAGEIAIDDRAVTLRGLDVAVGSDARLTVGADPGRAGKISLGPGMPPAVTALDLPLRATVRGLALPFAIVDDAALDARVTGSEKRLRVAGDLVINAVRVPPKLRPAALKLLKRSPRKPGAVGPPSAFAAFDPTELDLRVRARPGALDIEIDDAPDLELGLDFHVGGTVGRPMVSGGVKPSGVFTTIALWIYRLFH